MRRLLVIVLIGLVLLGAAAPVHAGSAAANVALGLAAFAVFNQLLFAHHAYAYPGVVYAPAPAYTYAPPAAYVAPRVVYAAPPARVSAPTVVRYPHGSWELRGDGVTVAYQWVWIPAAPPPPPPPPPGQPPAPPPGATR